MKECMKGWCYEIHNDYKLISDNSTELPYINFIVKFDGRIISTRFLYKKPTLEECKKLLEETKRSFLK